MQRILTRIRLKLPSINKIRFQCTQNIDQEKEQRYIFRGHSKYFMESKQYNMFRSNSVMIHQFDDETRNLTTWKKPESTTNIEWSQLPATYSNCNLIDAFEKVINYSIDNGISLSDESFDYFIDEFLRRMPDFTLNETLRALQMFARIPMRTEILKQRNYIELYMAFDQQCTILAANMFPEQLLYVCSVWQVMLSAKKTKFARVAHFFIQRYMKTMNAKQLTQAIFFMNCMNQPVDDIRALENLLENLLDDMTIEEVSIVSWCFYRLDCRLEKVELREKYFDYLVKQDLSQMDDIYLMKTILVTIF